MRACAVFTLSCVAIASCAHTPHAVVLDKTSRGVERRYVAPPGEGPSLGPGLSTKRLPFSPQEAAALEARLFAHLASSSSSEVWETEVRGMWPEYVLLFEKVGSSNGDVVVIRGTWQDALNSSDPDHPPAHVTVEALRSVGLDGGCTWWTVQYDVRTKRFERVGCNGQA